MNTESKNRKSLGQFFTTHLSLKEKVLQFIHNNPSVILEPSIGQGDLIVCVKDKYPNIIFDMYELDTSIKLLDNVNKEKVVYGDFMKQNIVKKYTTIIGNPPYVRTKKGNLYIDFIKKCVDLLEDNGELIFIIPSDFFKLTSSSELLNDMMKKGTFTHIYHPHDEKLFTNASIDVIVFRYCKNKYIEKPVLYNDEKMFIHNNEGFITFSKEKQVSHTTLGDIFDIYVGMVSGKESVYKNDKLGNMDVLNGYGKVDKYICIDHYPSENENINHYLLEHKQELINRKIRSFNESNWFEWGAPRNKIHIQNNKDKECIYVCTLTRKKDIAFVGKVQYFGGGLIILIPKRKCDLYKISSYLNSPTYKTNFIFSGRFKIGHRQLCRSSIPTDYL